LIVASSRAFRFLTENQNSKELLAAMAIGVRSRQINEYIVKQFHIGMLYRMGKFVKPILPVIRNVPTVEGHPFGTVARPEVYENLCWLFERWAPEYDCDYLRTSSDGILSSFRWTGHA
jgi:hypothetical protein